MMVFFNSKWFCCLNLKVASQHYSTVIVLFCKPDMQHLKCWDTFSRNINVQHFFLGSKWRAALCSPRPKFYANKQINVENYSLKKTFLATALNAHCLGRAWTSALVEQPMRTHSLCLKWPVIGEVLVLKTEPRGGAEKLRKHLNLDQ